MSRLALQQLSWTVSLATCIAVGLPVPLLADPDVSSLGVLGWTVVFAVFLASMVVASLAGDGRRARAAYVVQVVAGATLVLSAPQAGWLPILVVFTAALGVYVVGLRGALLVVVLNTAVIATSALLGGLGAGETAFIAGLYVAIQLGTVLTGLAILREEAMRLQLSEAHLELRAATALLAESSRADERLRIARDLHDLLGHQLTVLTLELETAKHVDAHRAHAHVERAEQVARGLLADVRSTVGALRHRAPDLRETLGRLVLDIPRPRIVLDVSDEVTADEEQTTALVRAVQEIVTNTIRHAEATELRISLRVAPDGQLVLEAADDGRGATRLELGNGLRGMVERVEALGGEVSFRGDDGFAVTARVPVG